MNLTQFLLVGLVIGMIVQTIYIQNLKMTPGPKGDDGNDGESFRIDVSSDLNTCADFATQETNFPNQIITWLVVSDLRPSTVGCPVITNIKTLANVTATSMTGHLLVYDAPNWYDYDMFSGVTTMQSVGNSPNTAGATISANSMQLQPADSTHPGVVTTGSQTLSGIKSFENTINFNNAGVLESFTGTPLVRLIGGTGTDLGVGLNATGSASNGTDNCAFGHYALAFLNAGSGYNTAVGTFALNQATVVEENVAVGYFAGYAVTTAQHNVLVGSEAGITLQTGAHNTLSGYLADVSASGVSDSVAIGANTISNSSSIALGSNSHAQGVDSVVIGESSLGNSNNVVAVGDGATVATASDDSIAVGQGASCSAAQALAFGRLSSASATNAIAFGDHAIAGAMGAVAFGKSAASGTANDIAIGAGANASGIAGNNIVIGPGASSGFDNAICIGPGATADQNGAIALATAAGNLTASVDNTVAQKLRVVINGTPYWLLVSNNNT